MPALDRDLGGDGQHRLAAVLDQPEDATRAPHPPLRALGADAPSGTRASPLGAAALHGVATVLDALAELHGDPDLAGALGGDGRTRDREHQQREPAQTQRHGWHPLCSGRWPEACVRTRWKWVLGALAILLVLAYAVAFLIDEPLRRTIERQMNARMQGYTAR